MPNNLSSEASTLVTSPLLGSGIRTATQRAPSPDDLWARFTPLAKSTLLGAQTKQILEREDLFPIAEVFDARPNFMRQLANVCERSPVWEGRGIHPLRFVLVVATVRPRAVDAVCRAMELSHSIENERFTTLWKILSSRELHPDRIHRTADVDTAVSGYLAFMSRFAEFRSLERLNPSDIERVAIILDQSVDPRRDLEFVFDQGVELPRDRGDEVLARYYAAGYRRLFHPKIESILRPGYLEGRPNLRARAELARFACAPEAGEESNLVRAIGRAGRAGASAPEALLRAASELGQSWQVVARPLEAWESRSFDHAFLPLFNALPLLRSESRVRALVGIDEMIRLGRRPTDHHREVLERGDVERFRDLLREERIRESRAAAPDESLESVVKRFIDPGPELPKVDRARLDRAVTEYRAVLLRCEALAGRGQLELEQSARAVAHELQANPESRHLRIEAFAHARELLRLTTGKYLYHEQFLSALLITDDLNQVKGRFGQVSTGEGKSLIIAAASAFLAAAGRCVDIVTSDPYLARRDAATFEKFYESFGIGSAVLDAEKPVTDELRAARVRYTTGESLGFSYLRSLLNQGISRLPLPFDLAFVDEWDNLTLDRSDTTLRIGKRGDRAFEPDELRTMLAFVESSPEIGSPSELIDRFLGADRAAPSAEERMTLMLYLMAAVQANKMRLGHDYLIENGSVVAFDWKKSGRAQRRMSLALGLQELLHAKEKLDPPSPSSTMAQISYATLFSQYRSLLCVSGTFGDAFEVQETSSTYGITGFTAPERLPSKRVDRGFQIHELHGEWTRALDERVERFAEQEPGRPMLFLFGSIDDPQLHYERTKSRMRPVQLITDALNLDTEGKSVSESVLLDGIGTAGRITSASSLAGRGVDPRPDLTALRAGGLHVVFAFLPPSLRHEKQGFGRAARQGEPGSTEGIICLETDPLLRELPPEARELLRAVARLAPQGDAAHREEIRRAIVFVRRCATLQEIRTRALVRERGDAAFRGFAGYIAQRNRLAADLATSKGLTGNAPREAADAALQHRWIRRYDRFDQELALPFLTAQPDDRLQGERRDDAASRLHYAYSLTYGHEYSAGRHHLPSEVAERTRAVVEAFVERMVPIELELDDAARESRARVSSRFDGDLKSILEAVRTRLNIVAEVAA